MAGRPFNLAGHPTNPFFSHTSPPQCLEAKRSSILFGGKILEFEFVALFCFCVECLCGWCVRFHRNLWISGQPAPARGLRDGEQRVPGHLLKHWDWPPRRADSDKALDPSCRRPHFYSFQPCPLVHSLPSPWGPVRLSQKTRQMAPGLWGWFAHRQGAARLGAWAAIWKTLGPGRTLG